MANSKNESDPQKDMPRIKEGPRIFIDTLLSGKDYRECARKYPNSFKSPEPAPYFKSEFDWRYRMGEAITPAEIKAINLNLEKLREFIIQKQIDEAQKLAENAE